MLLLKNSFTVSRRRETTDFDDAQFAQGPAGAFFTAFGQTDVTLRRTEASGASSRWPITSLNPDWHPRDCI